MGFISNKVKIEDYEQLLDKGFCLAGNYARLNDQSKACCEVYQYKVKAVDFKLNRNQKQAMTRFHRWLATGSVNAVGV